MPLCKSLPDNSQLSKTLGTTRKREGWPWGEGSWINMTLLLTCREGFVPFPQLELGDFEEFSSKGVLGFGDISLRRQLRSPRSSTAPPPAQF